MNNEYFMRKALDLAENALASGEFPVGCVVEYKGEIVAAGQRTGTAGRQPNEVDHAELIALRRLAECTLAEGLDRATLFCTLEPCLMCFGAILLSGVGKIVYAYEDAMGGGTQCDLSALPPLYQNRSIAVVPNVLRKESLKLLKAYFSDPRNAYWRGSLLAEYTLSR
jgi:tRNA(adenine34) deaminase